MTRWSMVLSVFVPIAGCCAAAHASISFDDVLVEYWVGSGDSEAMMIADWQADRMLAFGYRWDAGVPDDLDLFEAVNAHSDRFYREWVSGVPFGAVFGVGWDADGDGFSKTDPDDWYEEGWLENGYWSQWVSGDGELWDFGGGLGMHDLYDGAWIGWSWAPEFLAEPPDVPLIPTPATIAVMALGALARAPRRR